MRFDKDLFISYSHIDNQPLTAQQQGWITRFHDSMSALLSMRIGRKAQIWRDDKLRGNDVFADEIIEQFAGTAMLISVLTPRYLTSEWCTREIREFCAKADQSGGVSIDNKARIFKVLKAPIDTQDALPDVAKQLLGYEFFTYEDGAPLELDPAYGEKFAQDYNRKVGKLAWDLAQLLKRLDSPAEPSPATSPAPIPSKPPVYLAECSHDQRDAREMLEADLKLHGYTILPDQRLPLDDETTYVTAVTQLLERCALSIHLVGRGYGAVPDGASQKSIVLLQNEIAARRSQRDEFPRVVWLPAETRSEQANQQAFIDALHNNADVQRGADLLTGDFEELKAAVHAALKKLETPPPEPPASGVSERGGAKVVYLMCDEKDRKATVLLRKYLKERGIAVSLPAFEGGATAVRDANQQLLNTCEAIIVFYGVGDEAWKRSADNELKKLRGMRRGAALPCYTYLADPPTHDKQDLVDIEEAGLIDGRAGFREADLKPLVSLLAPGGAVS